jgi:hypothetical protein
LTEKTLLGCFSCEAFLQLSLAANVESALSDICFRLGLKLETSNL